MEYDVSKEDLWTRKGTDEFFRVAKAQNKIKFTQVLKKQTNELCFEEQGGETEGLLKIM